VLDETAVRPTGFSVDAEIARGLLGFEASKTARIVVDFHQGAGEHLYETPLKKDQILERRGNDVLRLSAEVPLSNELVWWLLGFGGRVEVQEPPELRARIAAEVSAAAAHYR
jgi:predicted DNA-binding transcriptional regulator YafY